MNITLYIDEATVKKVRKIAVDKGATLNAMVHEYLISVAESDTATRKEQADRLMASTERPPRVIWCHAAGHGMTPMRKGLADRSECGANHDTSR